MNKEDLKVQGAIDALSGDDHEYLRCRVISEVFPRNVEQEYSSNAHFGGQGRTTITCDVLYTNNNVQELMQSMYRHSGVALSMGQLKRYALVELTDK